MRVRQVQASCPIGAELRDRHPGIAAPFSETPRRSAAAQIGGLQIAIVELDRRNEIAAARGDLLLGLFQLFLTDDGFVARVSADQETAQRRPRCGGIVRAASGICGGCPSIHCRHSLRGRAGLARPSPFPERQPDATERPRDHTSAPNAIAAAQRGLRLRRSAPAALSRARIETCGTSSPRSRRDRRRRLRGATR